MEITAGRIKAEAIRPDVIIVLGAGLLRGDEGNIFPSAQTLNNMDKAVKIIIDNNLDIPVVLSGGFTYKGMDEATAMYMHWPVSKLDIFLEFKSKNSYENIRNSLDLVEKEHWKWILIIDQPMHLFQLKLLARKELRRRKLKIHLAFIGAEPVWGNNIQPQWSSPFKFFLYEVLSTGYYLLKGKIL